MVLEEFSIVLDDAKPGMESIFSAGQSVTGSVCLSISVEPQILKGDGGKRLLKRAFVSLTVTSLIGFLLSIFRDLFGVQRLW